ncbi:MAG: S46 family peptidase, partial [Rikenellaceae bacterium]|nr:S46 family peptidase [Rikenellaceae bacterium]
MRRTLTTLLFSVAAIVAFAEEGMWLPSVIGSARLADMQAKGLKLTAQDLYDINQASLKDAIVHLGGCTGEVISDQGLMLTNHHCGYGNIQKHSTVEHDYLTNGFWAMSHAEELPNPGYTASFLKYMEDVTEQVNKGVKSNMTPEQASDKRAANIKKIIAAATKNNGYRATVESLYYGNQYFMFVYETYRDVRLVGCPPSAIGKFGGDTDNWMWPRHTGDFCLFRIYADKDNKPADYSADNVPYTPKRSFAISTKGVKEGDFTFIYGYPGRTYEYITSDAVRYIAQKSNPAKIALRTARLDVMNRYQGGDAAVRIKYAAKNASVSNAWKKWQGETKGVVRLGVVAQKEALEEAFAEWAADKPQYAGLVDSFSNLYGQLEPYAFALDYYNESVRAIELLRFGSMMSAVPAQRMMSAAKSFYKDYHRPIDEEIARKMVRAFVDNVDSCFWTCDMKEAANDTNAWVEKIFSNSILTDSTA